MAADDLDIWRQILTPTGVDWSGRARYAAAMQFHLQGMMPAEVLEIYRICARLDHEDPLDALRAYRMGDDWIARAVSMREKLALSVD
jgi:hypothetical protein